MDYAANIRHYAHQPLTHQLLISMLKDYKRPNDKIHLLLKEGVLQSIKKGLYIAGPALGMVRKPEPILLANHIWGPSYVSCETALAYHGFIPERVYEITSMTTKASRTFNTPVGIYTYTKLALPYYSFGLQRVQLSDDEWALIASPEKAVCDKIITTTGILFRSKKTVREFLLENMRMEESKLKELNTQEIASWVQDAVKEKSLIILTETINEL